VNLPQLMDRIAQLSAGADPVQSAVTLVFLLVVLGMFFRIAFWYRGARRGIATLREVYDRIIRVGEEREQPESVLAEQELEALDDARSLLVRRAGIGRKVKFHSRYRHQREKLRHQVERARSATESLPIVGILGTILGLVMASMGQDSIKAMTGGMSVALSSSLCALFFMLVSKFWFEAGVLSELENLEDREGLVFEYVALREDALDALDELDGKRSGRPQAAPSAPAPRRPAADEAVPS
jgi:biopolymer transport protein ExbB/TolQ